VALPNCGFSIFDKSGKPRVSLRGGADPGGGTDGGGTVTPRVNQYPCFCLIPWGDHQTVASASAEVVGHSVVSWRFSLVASYGMERLVLANAYLPFWLSLRHRLQWTAPLPEAKPRELRLSLHLHSRSRSQAHRVAGPRLDPIVNKQKRVATYNTLFEDIGLPQPCLTLSLLERWRSDSALTSASGLRESRLMVLRAPTGR